MWDIRLHPDATIELANLSSRERTAMVNAIEKLAAFGPALPFPHSSDVRGVEHLRELRPRAGRSPWRGFYRRIGSVLVIAAIGPEAEADRRGFERAIAAAATRLIELQEDRS